MSIQLTSPPAVLRAEPPFPPLEGRAATAVYRYEGEAGELLFAVGRWELDGGKKTFQQAQLVDGRWQRNLDGVRRVLYRLPAVLAHVEANAREPLYIVEGEKDVHAIEQAGGVATCNPMGAGKWRDEHAEQLRSARRVIVVVDRDDEEKRGADGLTPGERHTRDVAASLAGVGIIAELVQAAEGKDAADHLKAGRPLDELEPFEPASPRFSSRPFSMPLREFVALDRPDVEPLLTDTEGRPIFARHSLTLLGALGGAGKTTWFVELALHLAAGADYLCFLIPRPVSILLIENEGPESMFADKLAAKLASFPHELKARIDVCTLNWGGFSLADDTHRALLRDEIAAHDYDLVFGDPLDALGIDGVGSPDDTRKFVELMKDTGLFTRVAWWLNTHPRKEETREALNEIAGAWGGKPDAVLLLKMLADDRTQIRFPKLRWAKRGKRPAILLGFDPDTECFTYFGEEDEAERDYLAEVTALLSDGVWRIVKEIVAPKAGIGASVDTVKRLLEEHPDVFESRTGHAARELGRHFNATVWQLVSDDPEGQTFGHKSDKSDSHLRPSRVASLEGQTSLPPPTGGGGSPTDVLDTQTSQTYPQVRLVPSGLVKDLSATESPPSRPSGCAPATPGVLCRGGCSLSDAVAAISAIAPATGANR